MITPKPEWDFSAKEWAKILSSLRCLPRKQPLAPCEQNPADERPEWLEIARTELMKAARRYLSSVELERAPTARLGKWKKVERQAAELRKAIRLLDDPRDRLILDQIEVEAKVKADQFLRSVRTGAGVMVRSLGRKAESRIEHRPASKVFHRELFRVWTWMGGELRGDLGYRQINNEPWGPLISFMQAVMRPILGKAPPAETIRHWINEEEKLRAEEDAASHDEVEEAVGRLQSKYAKADPRMLADLYAVFSD
jgi:hypothetical protein